MNISERFLPILIILAIISFLPGCHRKPGEIFIADYVTREHLTTNLDSIEIKEVVDTLLKGTKWNGKIQINQTYNPDIVNIYIINGNATYIKENDNLGPLLANCTYMGNNIIFLDDAYLRSFLDRHHVAKDPYNAVLKDDQACFLYWAIGHELGHLVCGHLRGHLDAGSLDHFVKSSSIDNREELQADSFFVRAITPYRSLQLSEERLMMSILNAEIEQKTGKVQTYGVGILYDYTNEHVVSYARQPTHPEYVVRLSRMLELSSRMNGDSGLSNLVSGFIKQLKEVK